MKPVLLDSSNGEGWSLLGWNPDRLVRGWMRPTSCTSPLIGAQSKATGFLSPGNRWPLATADPGAEWSAAMAGEEWCREESALPLVGGWVGYCGFECGHAYEPFPWVSSKEDAFPDYVLARYRCAALWSPEGTVRLLWAEPCGSTSADSPDRVRPQETKQEVLDEWRQWSQQATKLSRSVPQTGLPNLRSTLAAGVFQRRVARLRSWIGTGELFQANLSHRMKATAPENPSAFYARIRRSQPTSMSAYWQWQPQTALCSWSPELFLRVDGNKLESRPIKGTAARVGDNRLDAISRQQLESSAKELAELNMIVDMARNDLGRLAPPGGIHVPSTGEVETFSTLFHRVARVCGTWDSSRGPAALLKATFPPASVTGAPKVRALQAIAELEQEARGPYCGAFGIWEPGANPRAQFSVLIRTAEWRRRELSVRVGAGIVWDSDPETEWQETLLKARYLNRMPRRSVPGNEVEIHP